MTTISVRRIATPRESVSRVPERGSCPSTPFAVVHRRRSTDAVMSPSTFSATVVCCHRSPRELSLTAIAFPVGVSPSVHADVKLSRASRDVENRQRLDVI